MSPEIIPPCVLTELQSSLYHVAQVTVMVDAGHELGISIRGGAEHGLGIYISAVEEGSVAEAYGIKVMTDK